MQDKRNTGDQSQQGGIGRSNLINEMPENAGPDEEKIGYTHLGKIDQCEGNMNNGTIGGNFNDDIQIGGGSAEGE